MIILDYYYILLAALVNILIVFLWNQVVKGPRFSSWKVWGVIFVGSILNAWGLDIIQSVVESSTVLDSLKVSLGCWILFLAASVTKFYAINGVGLKQFGRDYGGELIGYFIMGQIINFLV